MYCEIWYELYCTLWHRPTVLIFVAELTAQQSIAIGFV